MKRLLFAGLVLLAAIGAAGLAQSQELPEGGTVTGPVELHNPHRRDSIGSTSPIPVSAPTAQAVPTPTLTTSTPSTTLFADGKYLFVLRGNSLFQFDKKTLKLLRSATLPSSVPSPSNQNKVKSFTSSPLRPAPDFPIRP